MGNRGNGFYNDHCSNLTTVALPQNAVIVMATTTAMAGGQGGAGGGSQVDEAVQGRGLSLTHSGQLLLSPPLPPPALPAAKPASQCPASPTAPSLAPPPGVTTLSLTLLPSPVIGGLFLTPSSSSHCSPPPTPAATSSPSPPLPPPSLPLSFDPDSFLNSPKQGQTYGGPPPQFSTTPSPVMCSGSPLSPPSLALSLSPTSTPPSSVSPPSSLSSSCETDRRDSSSSSSSLPLSLSLSPSSSVAPPLLPLCLELGSLGGSAGSVETAEGDSEEVKGRRGDDDDDEGSAPPTKLALLQVSSLGLVTRLVNADDQ